MNPDEEVVTTPTITTKPQVIVNKLTKAQFEQITPVVGEFYIITDEDFDAVTDVRVDGDSVVVNGIASISLEHKQDKLVAGDNITIDEATSTISSPDSLVINDFTVEG